MNTHIFYDAKVKEGMEQWQIVANESRSQFTFRRRASMTPAWEEVGTYPSFDQLLDAHRDVGLHMAEREAIRFGESVRVQA